jgi:hypothetical protein
MHLFSDWAPHPKTVAVKVEGHAYPMQSAERGWWHAEVEFAEHGSNYGCLLDDAAFLDWYRRLIALRREYADLRDCDLAHRVDLDESAQWLAIERGIVLVLCNYSEQPNEIVLQGGATQGFIIVPSLAANQIRRGDCI